VVSVFFFPVRDVLVLQHVRILPNIMTSGEVFTLLNMFEVEENLMLLEHVICPKVNRRTFCSRGMHDVNHDFGDVDFFSPRECLPLSCHFLVFLLDSSGVIFFLFFKEGSNSVLPPELLPGLSG
jgi:hypothetical protein